MIKNLKNNTKIKLISLLSALVLWLYVMTVEDPVELRTFNNIPITITNMSMLEDRGLAIYPKEELLADISIKANLSSLRTINRDNIYIYGRLDDPKEGKNAIYLQANLPERVNKYDIKPSVITVDLEKVVDEKRSIEVSTKGKSNINIDNIEINKKTANVTGPRSVVNKVTSIKATVDVDKKEKDFSTKVKLVPVDKSGNEVEDVKLEDDFVVATVKFLQQKVVPVKLKLEGSSEGENNIKDYKISPNEITIEGKKESLDKINSISTKPVKIEDLKDANSVDIGLDIPNGIRVNDNISSVKIDIDKSITSEFIIPKSNIDILNKESDIDTKVDLSKVPDDIKVIIVHSDEISNLSKDDIQLYIDMTDKSKGEGKYIIKYKSKYNFKEVKIDPQIVEI
ncbi:CdaR family protein [Paraclostridium tenue]